MGMGDADGISLAAGPFNQQVELFSDKGRGPARGR